MTVLNLGPEYFTGVGASNRAYALTAKVERAGRVVYEATPSTVRLAPGSEGFISRLRPMLRLRPVDL